MTQTMNDFPTLTWGEQGQRWLQAATVAATVAAAMLQEKRLAAVGAHAWSTAENAARLSDRVMRLADPAVRLLNADEQRIAATIDPEDGWAIKRSATTEDGAKVNARCAPLPNGRWALQATAVDVAGTTSHAAVSCASEDHALALVEDLMSGDASQVGRLAEFAALATARAEQAARSLAEPEEQRLARTAAAIRTAWSPRTADLVLQDDAFGALAWRLHEAELLGYSLQEALDHIDTAAVAASTTRHPAAMAEWFIRDLDVRQGRRDDAAHRPSELDREPAASPRAAATATADPVEPHQPAERRRRGAAEAEAATGVAATGEVIAAQVVEGEVVAAEAAAPAAPPQDDRHRVAMAQLVVDTLPQEAAEKVLRCKTWPGVADDLARRDRAGEPLAEMLTAVKADRVLRSHVRTPAAYLNAMLNDVRPDGDAAGATDPPPAPEPAVTQDGAQLDPSSSAAAAAGAGAEPGSGHADEVTGPVPVAGLNPDSAVNRVALHAAVGQGGAAATEELEARLAAAEEQARRTHAAAAAVAGGRAARAEIDSARTRQTSDDPASDREDLAAGSAAEVDQQRAAQEWTTSTQEEAEAAAAAGRAAAVYTRHPTAPIPTTSAPAPTRPRTVVPQPSPHRRQDHRPRR